MWWMWNPRASDHIESGPDTGISAPRSMNVTASDGVSLHVDLMDSETSDVTIILCHGYLLDSHSWDLQRAALARNARLVLWDQRGHGLSGWNDPPNATVDQLGQDLYAVLEATAPQGPVVLIGHSMGGMAILGLAESHPELFGDRVSAVALLATSAGGLSGVTLGLPVRAAHVLHQALRTSLWLLVRQARVIDAVRRATGSLSFRLTRKYLFASRVLAPVPALTTLAMSSTPIAVLAAFFSEFDTFDKRAALSVLGQVRTLVLVGDRDTITPVSHSEALAQAAPGARLSIIPEAGHLVALERPQEVNEQLRRLVAGARGVTA
jgi:pimeloyl-ACP methyl ester carboxylesterase